MVVLALLCTLHETQSVLVVRVRARKYWPNQMQSAPRQLALIHGCQMRVGATMWHHALGVAVAVLLAASTLGKHSTRRMPAVEQWRARRCKFSRGFIA